MSAPSAVSIRNISKSFGKTKVLHSVDISLERGDIYALIGPNGSGKTTLIKTIVGLLTADSGSVNLLGHDIEKEPENSKNTFGYVSDGPLGYDFLSGSEFLALTASLRGLTGDEAKRSINELANPFSLADVLPQSMTHYSRGNLQKVAFIAALLGHPQILIIDEPIVGLDPGSITVFGQKIQEFAKRGGIVFFVTHTLSFGEKYANRFGLLKTGRLVDEGTLKPHLDLETIYHKHVGYE